MSRATISTANMTFRPENSKDTSASGDPCHVLVLADFSGRSQRGLNNTDSIRQRKIIEVDRDNFDEVLAQLNVQCNLPLTDEALCFKELDDMHPDFIYERVPLFEKLRALKRKLKSPSTFAAAAEEIYQWHQETETTASTQATPTATDNSSNLSNSSNSATKSSPDMTDEIEKLVSGGSLLDNILSDSSDSSASSGGFDVQALVKDIIAPYVSPSPDPREKELLQTVDDASSNLMRKIMHHPHFQDLESSWRSLYFLVRRTETSHQLKIFIVDISQQELIDDALSVDALSGDNQAKGKIEQSNLYKLLVSGRASTGATPFSLLMHDASFGHSANDIKGFAHLGAIGAACGAITVTGGTEQLAGCQSLNQTPDKDDWDFALNDEIADTWQKLRTQPQASAMILTAPRYLCRMPYGQKTDPAECFNYEELPADAPAEFHLWGSGAWLVTQLCAQNYSVTGDYLAMQVQEIDRLPLHISTVDGESKVTPCAEVDMLDAAASELQATGLTVIRSILNKDSVVIPELLSIES